MEDNKESKQEDKKILNKDTLDFEKLNFQIEKMISSLVEKELKASDVDLIGKLIDIHKDIANEEYWRIKEEVKYMVYSDYGRRGVPGTGRGRYKGAYGRRGVPGSGRGRYGHEMMNPLDEMNENYEIFNETVDEVYNGNYGAEGEMIKSVEGIMRNLTEIVDELSEADNPEVMRIIKKYTRKMSEMA